MPGNIETHELTSAEIERNSLYVKYKKSKILYDKALVQGTGNITELKGSMESNLRKFLVADEACPIGKRLWKNGYSANTVI